MDTEYCVTCGILHDPNDGDCLGCQMQDQLEELKLLNVEQRKEIEKLRECLEFYADPMNYLAPEPSDIPHGVCFVQGMKSKYQLCKLARDILKDKPSEA